jgi:hypothetical protein
MITDSGPGLLNGWVEDPHAAAQQLIPLGAREATHQDPDDPHLLVMLDPAGHPFCLIRSSAAERY